jgi:hypothetical protein
MRPKRPRQPKSNLGIPDAQLPAMFLKIVLHMHARGQEIRDQDHVLRTLFDTSPAGRLDRRLGQFQEGSFHNGIIAPATHLRRDRMQVIIGLRLPAAMRNQEQRYLHTGSDYRIPVGIPVPW